MMLIKKFIFKQLLFFFSFFVKPKKDKWVISLLKGGGGSSLPENAFFFCKYLQDKNINFKYVSYYPIKNINGEHLKPFTLQYFIELLVAGVLIIENDLQNDIPSYRSRKTLKVHLFHGLALKKVYLSSPFTKNIFNKNFKNILRKILVGFCFTDEYNLIVTSNNIHKNIYVKSFNNKNVQILGQPRNDFLLKCKTKNIREKVLNQLNLINFKGKIISYLPTFRDTKAFGNLDILKNKKIIRFLENNNCIFLGKDHFFYENNYGNFTKKTDLKNTFNLGNEFLTQEILAITDILITDYSGIYFDYLLTKKPIIFYCYDYEEYININREINFDYFDNKITPGPKVKNIDDLTDNIKKYIINPEKDNSLRVEAMNRFHNFKDGNNCQRILNFINTNLEKN